MLRLRLTLQLACALGAFSAFANMASAKSFVITTAAGQTVAGDLVRWGPDRIEVLVNGSPQAFAPTELLGIRPEQPPTANTKFAPFIALADESELAIKDFTVKDRVASVATRLSDEPFTIPVDQIRLVKWADIEVNLPSEDATGDSVAVFKRDSTVSEVLTGIVGNVTADQVEFTWEGETLPVKRSKIAALSFFQNGGQAVPAEPLCYLELATGARLAARELEIAGDVFEVTTITGLELRVPVNDLIEADYSAGKLSYLSDMRPLKSKWTPLIELPAAAESIRNFGAPRMNISFSGSPLTLLWPAADGGPSSLKTYDKGLALRSRTELEYRLPKNMRRFVAIAGIDPETLAQGNVLLRIEADGDTFFEQTISGSEGPIEIDADIADKQKLRILVDYGDNLDLGDRMHLVEARLVK